MSKVESIRDGSFLVVHGTADDNVLVQHTMLLSKTLVQNHIIFRQQVRGRGGGWFGLDSPTNVGNFPALFPNYIGACNSPATWLAE